MEKDLSYVIFAGNYCCFLIMTCPGCPANEPSQHASQHIQYNHYSWSTSTPFRATIITPATVGYTAAPSCTTTKKKRKRFPWTLRRIVCFAKNGPRKNVTRLMVVAVASANLTTHSTSYSATIAMVELDGGRHSSEHTLQIRGLARSRS
jgi:hypothetical protein